MRWIHAARLRMRSLFRGAQVEAELDEELRDHIERQAEAFVGKGMPPDEARAAALRAMGGIDQQKEACRDTWAVRCVEDEAFEDEVSDGVIRGRSREKGPATTPG